MATLIRSDTLPIIDLGPFLTGAPGARAEAGAQLRRALEEVGFFQIVNHGIDWAQVEDIYQQAARYHALPLEAKLPQRMTSKLMGYSPLSDEQYAGAKAALNTAFFMARPTSSRNQWPDEATLPGFRAACSAYYERVEALGQRLLELYAVGLGLAADHFQSFFAPSLATLRMSHYPPIPAEDGQWGIDPHTDAGFMTLLPSNPVAGLWIRRPDGTWFEPPQEPHSFVVNSGDMLRRWSNDRLLSTMHRVRNVSTTDRYAIPFFFDPRVDAVIECLPTCADEDHPVRYPPITYRDYLIPFMQRSYRGARDEPMPEAVPDPN